MGAVLDYSKAIELIPDYKQAYSERGKLLLEMQNYENAARDFKTLLQLDSLSIAAYINLALLERRQNNLQDAIVQITKAIEINPKSNEAYRIRGDIGLELKKYGSAIRDFSRAIDLDPSDSDSYFLRGFAKSDIIDYKGAMDDYSKAIELNPNDFAALNNRGVLYKKFRDFQSALADFRRAIEVNPQDAFSHYNRGNLKNDLGDYSGALSDYKTAIDIDPNYGTALKELGLLEIEMDRIHDGCLHLSKAGELGEDVYFYIRRYCQ